MNVLLCASVAGVILGCSVSVSAQTQPANKAAACVYPAPYADENEYVAERTALSGGRGERVSCMLRLRLANGRNVQLVDRIRIVASIAAMCTNGTSPKPPFIWYQSTSTREVPISSYTRLPEARRGCRVRHYSRPMAGASLLPPAHWTTTTRRTGSRSGVSVRAV
jgi:hypothetical protein